jgi:hypothetical protein
MGYTLRIRDIPYTGPAFPRGEQTVSFGLIAKKTAFHEERERELPFYPLRYSGWHATLRGGNNLYLNNEDHNYDAEEYP